MRIKLASAAIVSTLSLLALFMWSAMGDEPLADGSKQVTLLNRKNKSKKNRVKKHEAGIRSQKKVAPILTATQVRKILNTKSISIKYKKTPLRKVIVEIAGRASVNVIFDEFSFANMTKIDNEEDELDKKINLVLSNVSVHTALNTALEQHELAYWVNEETGIIHILSANDAVDIYFIRIYDCQDLLFPPGNAKAGKQVAGSQQKTTTIENSQYIGRSQAFVDLLMGVTDGPWEEIEGTGGTLSEFDGLLFVRHNVRGQRDVKNWIERIRTAMKAGRKVWVKYKFEKRDTNALWRGWPLGGGMLGGDGETAGTKGLGSSGTGGGFFSIKSKPECCVDRCKTDTMQQNNRHSESSKED